MPQSNEENFLESAGKIFRYYKKLGEGALTQLSEAEFFIQPNEGSNSIAHIIQHLSGNMLSRWTDFLTTDGEKPWRNREDEFSKTLPSRTAVMDAWESGWSCLLKTLDSLTPQDLSKIIYIRNEGQTVLEAVQRQLAHYPHHVGQIVYLSKSLKGANFQSLSIGKGQSEHFNQQKFSLEKERRHFTDSL